ncbi:hypothetical protein FJK98_00775 [Micromonospora sp. HM134]|uniref:hypothetical protein n=1 Tax=unclassified Micromonospora TaxID=2617518 RepID=UPI0011989EC7|nr:MULTISPECIES: hypothetical protein [unclassified Micromonospora]QDY05868.1 hypothetical protein FJK98_00775 [Micromonospora sp. HM134]
MSYPDQVPDRRPPVVTVAAALLGLMALAAGVYAVTSLLALGGTIDRFRGAVAGTAADPGDVDGVVRLLRISTVGAAVWTVLVALLLVGLAGGLLARRRAARVGVWVVCGLGLLAGGCALVVLVGQRVRPLRLGSGDQGVADLFTTLDDAYPSWWVPVNAGVSVAQALGYLVVAVLLALRPANTWFTGRRPARPGYGPSSFTAAPYPSPVSALPPEPGPEEQP